MIIKSFRASPFPGNAIPHDNDGAISKFAIEFTEFAQRFGIELVELFGAGVRVAFNIKTYKWTVYQMPTGFFPPQAQFTFRYGEFGLTV